MRTSREFLWTSCDPAVASLASRSAVAQPHFRRTEGGSVTRTGRVVTDTRACGGTPTFSAHGMWLTHRWGRGKDEQPQSRERSTFAPQAANTPPRIRLITISTVCAIQ